MKRPQEDKKERSVQTLNKILIAAKHGEENALKYIEVMQEKLAFFENENCDKK